MGVNRSIPSIASIWDGEVFRPLSSEWTSQFFEEDEHVFLKVDRVRYWPQHQAFMCFVRDAWRSLPEREREKYPTPDIFRYRMLIAAGYADTKIFLCGSEEEAHRTAMVIDKLTHKDQRAYRIMSIVGTDAEPDNKRVLLIKEAKSQSMRDMSNDEFRDSVRDVEEVIGRMFGVTRETIEDWKRKRW